MEKELHGSEAKKTELSTEDIVEEEHSNDAKYPECGCKAFCKDECEGCCCNKNGDENFEDDYDCEKPKCPLCSTGKKVVCGITIGVILTAAAVAIHEYFKK